MEINELLEKFEQVAQNLEKEGQSYGKMANLKAIELFGEYAKLNNITEGVL